MVRRTFVRIGTALAAAALQGVLRGAEAAPATLREAAPVVVIHGELSLGSAGDRRYALSLSRHAVRWFREGGLTADLVGDSGLPAALRGRKVAMLNHCDNVPPDHLAALRSFVGGGGRLIVCYSSSPGLADLMGVKTGSYLKAEPGALAAMLFDQKKPANTPVRILQSSPNIMTAAAVEGRSTVLAWWHDQNGRNTGQPAWLQSEAGFWMTHTLSADGSAAEKGRLLVSLAADRHPELWLVAARARLERAGRAGVWETPEVGRQAAAAMTDKPRAKRAGKAVELAIEARREARQLLQKGRGAESWLLANELDARLQEAYGLMQEPVAGEIRAVWDHSGQGLYPGDWARTCRMLKAAGITDIMVNVAAPGWTHCRLDVLPRSPVFEARGDQLAACLEAARPLGLRVHAWLIAFSTTQASAHRMTVFGERKWLLLDTAGKTTPWLDPANQEVRDMLVQASRELFERYAIDGLHLDFARYANFHESLGPDTRRRFELSRGAAVTGWPEAARKNPAFGELVRWRAAQVTALVADVRRIQRQTAPGRWVTAAVFGKHPSCVEAVGQDWESWIRQGYVDYVLPMNYTESANFFGELVASQTRTPRLARHIVGGIGVTASESRLDAAMVIDQVNALREGQAAGFALFDLDTTLEQDILPILKLGITGDEQ